MRESEEIQRDVSAIIRNIVGTMRKGRELPLEQIEKQKVIMLHIDFFGGIDFTTRDSEGNKQLN